MNDSAGNFSSSSFGTAYPPGELEERYFIDVREEKGDYVDLLFTILEFDLNGARGDYLKLVQGRLSIRFFGVLIS